MNLRSLSTLLFVTLNLVILYKFVSTQMAVNLDKNREAILAAWKDVLDEKTPTDW